MQHKRFKKSTYQMRPVNIVSQSGSTVNSYTELPGTHEDKYWYAPIIDRSAFELSGFRTGSSYLVGTCTGSPPNPVRISNLNNLFDKVVDLFGQSKFYNAVLGRGKGDGSTMVSDSSRCQDLIDIILGRFGGTVDLSANDTTMQPQIYVPNTNDCYEYFGNLKSGQTANYVEWDLPFYLNTAGDTTYYYCVMALSANGVSRNFTLTFLAGSTTLPYYPRDNGEVEVKGSDPYPNIPDSASEGGSGTGDFTGDIISEPSLPSKSAMGSGLVQLYNPTVSQLRSFGQWLWNANGFDLNDLKRVFNDPMDMIIGLSIFPVTPTVSATPDTIKLGNIDSEVSSNVLSSQFTRIDLGTINLEEVYGSYLDYAPYTKVQIFLPFIGIRDLDCDDVMGKAIHLTYSVDMLSGACVAHVLVNGSTMYEYGGSCNEQVPLTARDLTTIFSGIASVVATGAGAVAAISAGIAALPAEASAGAVLGTAGVGVTGAGASIARNVISSKPSVEHASGIGGTTGYLSCKKPYLIVQRPRLCHPENQEHFTGYPGFIYVSSLSQLTGFTKMVNVELTRIHATDEELQEIAEWLMNKGVRI